MIEIVMEVDDEFWNIINQLKEFKGQKEIIHCKDCKYSVDNEYCLFSTADMGEINKMDADDFCSRGERTE